MAQKRKRREYLRYLDAAMKAAEQAVDSFNRVHNPYKFESTLLLLGNAWELLAKSVLVKEHISIRKGQKGSTISCEVAIHKLAHRKQLDRDAEILIQQIVSLRNHAAHDILPEVPEEVQHHLLYFSLRAFRELIRKVYPRQLPDFSGNYLSISLSEMTTYADKVQRLVSKVRKDDDASTLVWLLERGAKFDGGTYRSQAEVERSFRQNKRILPNLEVGKYLKRADMVRFVPVQAPKNFTADLILRKGHANDASLPVQIKKTDIDVDYPYLTKELAQKLNLGKNFSAIARAVDGLKMRDDKKYHQRIRTGTGKSEVHRYSQAAYEKLKKHFDLTKQI